MTQRLTSQGYTPAGTYVGEAVGTGGTNAVADVHVLGIPGRGSRYIRVKNSALKRGFVYSAPLQFSSTAPHTAVLPVVADGKTSNAILEDTSGIEVRRDFWTYGVDNNTIVINDQIFDSTESYFLSYQSASFDIGDPIPTNDIRSIDAVGSQIDQDSYKRNVDYFVDTVITPPESALDTDGNVIQHTNATASFSDVTKTGSGTGVASISNSALYLHKYSRAYSLEVVSVVGTVITFEWTSTPISSGNDSAPANPLVAGLLAPSFSIDTTLPQTLTVDLEFGVRVDFTSGTYVIADAFAFDVYGPSLIEVESALTNTNQFASSSVVVPSVDNSGTGSVAVDAEGYALSENTNVVLEVTNVDAGVVVATVPSGTLTFGTVNPADGETITIDNGVNGSGNVAKTFEFDANGVVTAGNILVALGSNAAVASTGTITFSGSVVDSPLDGDTVTISDGSRTVVFEFDIDGSLVNAGAVRVIIDTTSGSQSRNTAANLVTAINASSLAISAVDVSTANANIGKLNLTHAVAGSIGNNGIVSSTSRIIAIGMNGGSNATSNVISTRNALIASINNANPRLGVVAYVDESDAGTVRLVHGARFVFSANPAPADTVTVISGSATQTYAFVASAPGANDILIGISTSATMDNIVAKLNASALNCIAVASVAGLNTVTVASKIARNVVLSESSTAITTVVTVIDNTSALGNGNKTIVSTASNLLVSGLSGGVDAQDSPDIVTFAYGTSGDAFASGLVSVAEGYNEGKFIALYGGARIKLSKAIATKSEGSITLNALPENNDTVVINDGVSVVTLTFKTVAALATDVAIVSGNISATTSNLLSAIASQGLFVDATKVGTSTVALVHKRTGSTYNNAITFTGSALTVIGFAGGASNYVAGDKFAFTLLAPRKYSTALDDRTVTMTVATVGISSPEVTDPGYVILSYSSNTPEGGFGEIEAKTSENGYFTLPGQIRLVLRNTHASISTINANLNRFVENDRLSFQHVNNGRIFWTLNKKATETKEAGDVLLDRNGSVTGKASTFYIVLKSKPFAGTLVVTNAGVAYTGWTLIAGTNIVSLNVRSASEVVAMKLAYTHRGAEPALGSSYFITANYLRPIEFYNSPRVFFEREDALEFLAPITADNDLAIGVNIAFDQEIKPKAIAIIQIRDADEDGVFSPDDIDTALAHTAGVTYITELVPLRLSNYLDKFLAFNVQGNDPFEKRDHMLGYGAPIGTKVGSELDEGTLVFTARRSLQVYGKSPAHGRRFMVATTKGRKKTTLSDGTVINPWLDGSFFALAVAAKIAGQADNGTTILNTNILGFNEVEVFNDTANRILGAASIIYFENEGNNVYKIKEDVTVDDTAPHFHEILATRTKIDATRTVRRECDKQLIGFVPPTRAAGVSTIRAKIVGILQGMVANGTIAPYQDDDGNARPINKTDVTVIRDENDPQLYHFTYVIFTKSAVKKLFGLYSVNENVFTPQA